MLALDLSEARLAKALKDFTYRHPFCFLDFRVQIHERTSKLQRQFAPNGALSRSHESDQIDPMHRYDYTMVPFTQKRELTSSEKILEPGFSSSDGRMSVDCCAMTIELGRILLNWRRIAEHPAKFNDHRTTVNGHPTI